MNPYQIVKDFEAELCNYTDARFAVTVNSCTMALLLCCEYFKVKEVEIPKFTYCSVPQSIIHAGGKVSFTDSVWSGEYQLKPYPIWDSARRFTSNMHKGKEGGFQCLSFHASKILGDTQGGCILHDNEEADVWFRRARFDGRTEGIAPKDDNFILGWHCYLSSDIAARLLLKLYSLPKDNPDLPNDDYSDLSKVIAFKWEFGWE